MNNNFYTHLDLSTSVYFENTIRSLIKFLNNNLTKKKRLRVIFRELNTQACSVLHAKSRVLIVNTHFFKKRCTFYKISDKISFDDERSISLTSNDLIRILAGSCCRQFLTFASLVLGISIDDNDFRLLTESLFASISDINRDLIDLTDYVNCKDTSPIVCLRGHRRGPLVNPLINADYTFDLAHLPERDATLNNPIGVIK